MLSWKEVKKEGEAVTTEIERMVLSPWLEVGTHTNKNKHDHETGWGWLSFWKNK